MMLTILSFVFIFAGFAAIMGAEEYGAGYALIGFLSITLGTAMLNAMASL